MDFPIENWETLVVNEPNNYGKIHHASWANSRKEYAILNSYVRHYQRFFYGSYSRVQSIILEDLYSHVIVHDSAG